MMLLLFKTFPVGPGFRHNQTFKLSFIVVFFWMFHNKKLFRRSSDKYRTFSEGPTWSDLFSPVSPTVVLSLWIQFVTQE